MYAKIERQVGMLPVTRSVKGYIRFVGKYVTGKRKRFRSYKVYNSCSNSLAESNKHCASVYRSVCVSVCLHERGDLGNYKS